jgi:hypothetical protein
MAPGIDENDIAAQLGESPGFAGKSGGCVFRCGETLVTLERELLEAVRVRTPGLTHHGGRYGEEEQQRSQPSHVTCVERVLWSLTTFGFRGAGCADADERGNAGPASRAHPC